jgi:hypothetical protein
MTVNRESRQALWRRRSLWRVDQKVIGMPAPAIEAESVTFNYNDTIGNRSMDLDMQTGSWLPHNTTIFFLSGSVLAVVILNF